MTSTPLVEQNNTVSSSSLPAHVASATETEAQSFAGWQTTYRFEVYEAGMDEPVAEGDGADRDRVIGQALHYAMMYGQDGSASFRVWETMERLINPLDPAESGLSGGEAVVPRHSLTVQDVPPPPNSAGGEG